MTANEARDRIGEIRAELRRAMRAVNRPNPDWEGAEDASGECLRLCAELQSRCWLNGWREKHGDR